jgi:hypothetical protein
MTLSFLTEATVSVLNQVSISKDKVKVPNNYKGFTLEQVELWKRLANLLGVNYEDTKTTVTVKVSQGKRVFYSPSVSSNGTEACIYWGHVVSPLSKITEKDVQLSIEGEKRPYLSVYFPSLDDSITFALMFPKPVEGKPLISDTDRSVELKKALRKNALHTLLAEGYIESIKLSQVKPGAYEVTGYQMNRYGKYELTTNIGVIQGNTALARKLDYKPLVDKDNPATLTVQGKIGTTSQGHDIIGALLVTKADSELKVYDLDDLDNEPFEMEDPLAEDPELAL